MNRNSQCSPSCVDFYRLLAAPEHIERLASSHVIKSKRGWIKWKDFSPLKKRNDILISCNQNCSEKAPRKKRAMTPCVVRRRGLTFWWVWSISAVFEMNFVDFLLSDDSAGAGVRSSLYLWGSVFLRLILNRRQEARKIFTARGLLTDCIERNR